MFSRNTATLSVFFLLYGSQEQSLSDSKRGAEIHCFILLFLDYWEHWSSEYVPTQAVLATMLDADFSRWVARSESAALLGSVRLGLFARCVRIEWKTGEDIQGIFI